MYGFAMMLRPCVRALVAVVRDREQQTDVGERRENDDGRGQHV